MEELEKQFIEKILTILQQKLARKLTPEEQRIFTQNRSYIAFEMVLGHVSDPDLDKVILEKYVENVVKENYSQK